MLKKPQANPSGARVFVRDPKSGKYSDQGSDFKGRDIQAINLFNSVAPIFGQRLAPEFRLNFISNLSEEGEVKFINFRKNANDPSVDSAKYTKSERYTFNSAEDLYPQVVTALRKYAGLQSGVDKSLFGRKTEMWSKMRSTTHATSVQQALKEFKPNQNESDEKNAIDLIDFTIRKIGANQIKLGGDFHSLVFAASQSKLNLISQLKNIEQAQTSTTFSNRNN